MSYKAQTWHKAQSWHKALKHAWLRIKKIHTENSPYRDAAIPILGKDYVNKFNNRYFKYIFRGDYWRNINIAA